ncbi:alpha/beta fold hydrolase [Halobacterium bonnevillei]|uniref:Alpha/beta fold hydrolase n=1 Tax=Halobacterium bonnevillei TaxID=2692200 RepID=A0A6B0SIW6_9EURY|nr:alpha/beta hydrolase [Halobacterium bonnevillei]MXR20456.1 alpha/beta fold hydrolase [Halobacterium bonnevillei]
MRLRRLLAGAVGTVAAAELIDRGLRAKASDLPPALPGAQGTYRWRGFDVAYTEAGDPGHPDVVCLHGVHAAASSREFADVFEDLAEDYHVIAPDLPGFGRSDRPPVAYTSSLYESFVTNFLADVADEPVVLGSSLSGSWATVAAERTDVAGLLLVCPTADTGPRRPWLRALMRTPVVGDTVFNAVTSKPSLRFFNERDAFYYPDRVTADVLDYQWRTAHQEGARFAPASFVGGFLDSGIDLGAELADRDCPVTLVWGREATLTSLSVGRSIAEDADARLVVVNETRLVPHAEQPEVFLDAVREDLPLLEHQ